MARFDQHADCNFIAFVWHWFIFLDWNWGFLFLFFKCCEEVIVCICDCFLCDLRRLGWKTWRLLLLNFGKLLINLDGLFLLMNLRAIKIKETVAFVIEWHFKIIMWLGRLGLPIDTDLMLCWIAWCCWFLSDNLRRLVKEQRLLGFYGVNY